MPALTPTSSTKILVTGASGFIAAWICRLLLEEGFAVRGTVRSDEKGKYLEDLFGEYGKRFEWVVVGDMQEEGSFDSAVRDVDAIIHTASPVTLHAPQDPNELIGPALKGTLGVLRSAEKDGDKIKRLIITSSLATIVNEPYTGILDESSWNTTSVKEVEEKGEEAGGMHKYRASKMLAEQAAWDFLKDPSRKSKFDLVTIHPSYVFGPIIHQVSSPASLNQSIKTFHEILTQPKTDEELAKSISEWVDVRDVAMAHVRSLTREEAGNKRFVTSNGPFTGQDILDTLNALDLPSLSTVSIPIGNLSGGKGTKPQWEFDNKAARDLLGIEFIRFERCVGDTAGELRKRGFL